MRADRNWPGARVGDCGDGDSDGDGGESERDVERHADRPEWIQRERYVDVYGGSAGDVRDYAADGDADRGGGGGYGDGGRWDSRGVQFCDSGNGQDPDACYG